MGSKTRLSSNWTKRGDNTVNLVMSRKTNARLARPIDIYLLRGPHQGYLILVLLKVLLPIKREKEHILEKDE